MLSRVKSGQSFTRFASTRRKPALLVLCLLLVTITSPVVSQSDEVADDVALDKHLSLQIEAPKDDLSWGDEALVRLTAANTGAADIEAVALNLQDQPGVAWGDDFKGQWLELGNLAAGESRVIEGHARVDGLPDGGTLSLFATLHGHDVEPAEATAALSVPGREAEEITVSKNGSLVDTADSRVQFTFPEGWNESDAQLTFHLQEQFRQERGDSGRLLLFTVEAAANDSLVEAFDAPIDVTINLGDLVDPEWSAGNRPVVSTRQSDKENWTAVESTFDPKTGILSFQTTHFSVYAVTTDPQLWKLQYNPPGASPYTGAATYQYPIDLPPGIGGLTPELSLHYSSRPADGIRLPAMGQGFGAGWSLPQAQINNGNAGNFYNDDAGGTGDNKNYDASRFTLVLNGMNYYLNPLQTSGRYGTFKAIGSPELYIKYVQDGSGADDTNNVSGEFWRVKTPDGSTYTFGKTADAEQVVWPMDTTQYRNDTQPRNQEFAPYNWKLNSVVDVHGNKIEYVYETACGVDFHTSTIQRGQDRDDGVFQCTEVDSALKEIRYNFDGATAQTVITFSNPPQNFNQTRQEKSMIAGVFRPAYIEVRQDSALIARFNFTYVAGAHYYGDWDVATEFWMLTSIERIGADPAYKLPIQTFVYNRNVTNGCLDGSCVRLLTEVSNGYGAVTTLTYANWSGTRWQHVTQTETWDGVERKKGVHAQGQTRVVYDRTGATACFDTAGSGCTMGEPSESLVGFDRVTINTQGYEGSVWKTVAGQRVTFINANYLLLGKTQKLETLDPDTSGVLVEDEYQWSTVGSPDGEHVDDRLLIETHTTSPSGTWMTSQKEYTYDALDPANGHYNALMKVEEKEKTDNPPWTSFRCTEYAYAHLTTGENWLVNRIAQETVRSGGCGAAVQTETRYRYAASNNPGSAGLDPRALLTYVLRWTGASYLTEKYVYRSTGLVKDVITFSSTSSTSAYTTDTRNSTRMDYTAMGVPSKIATSVDGVVAQTETIAYDTTFPWLVARVTDSNDIFTQYDYDNFGRLSMVAMPGDSLTTNGATIRYTYYDNGNAVFVSPFLVTTFYKGGIKGDERQFYDGLGRLVQTQTAKAEVDGVDKDIIATIAYDARGLEVCRAVPYGVTPPYQFNGSTPFKTAACATQSRTTTTYDTLGRVTGVTTPDGAVTETSYSVSTNVIVDGRSRLMRAFVYDANDHLRVNYTDVFGRLALAREYEGNSPPYTAYADTRYSYDVTGNLTAVKKSEAGNDQPALWQTTMNYDNLGRKTSMSDPDMGTWVYSYDAAGNLIRQQDPSSVLCFLYDNLNRLTQRYQDVGSANCPSGPGSGDMVLASYVYGSSDTANNIGKPVEVSWGPNPSQNKDNFTYDSEGRLQTQTRLIDNNSYSQTYSAYDSLDRPQTITLPNGEQILIGYDHEGEDTLKLKNGSTTTNVINAVGFTALGQPAYIERQGTAPETTLTYYGQSGNFRLSGIQHGGANDSFPDFAYTTYDDVGNVVGMTMKIGSTTETSTFGYDELNRLKTASLTNAGGANYNYTYGYDRLGNILSRTGSGGPAMTYTYGEGAAGPQAVTTITGGVSYTYAYDARGNIDWKKNTGVMVHDYTFDVENRLTTILTNGTHTMSFAYDADGRRVKTARADGTILYTPFPDYEVEDPPGAGANIIHTTYRIAGQIAALKSRTTGNGTLYDVYTDHLGNVVGLGQTNTWLANSQARFDPFGNFRTTPDPTINPDVTTVGFTGHRHNNTGSFPVENVGLIYMNARYYMPEIGRFISPDTIVPEPGNPQSFNRYSYSFNNPVNFTDPSGHDPLDAAWEEAFIAAHGRAPEWYDRLIRLFSIAFPEEWDWGAFYDNNGYLRSPEILRNIMMHPPSSRSWAAMPDALTRLSTYYAWNESDMFARDIGTLFGGLPDRASHGMNFAVTGCERIPAPICNSPTTLPAQDWAYLQPAGIPSYLRGDDADSNVHHWAWGVALGAYIGDLAVAANTAREAIGVGGINNLMSDSNAMADVYFGNRGAYFGSALRTFGPRASSLLYSFYVGEW